MAESSNTNMSNTANMSAGVIFTIAALALLMGSGALFLNLSFINEIATMSEAVRYGVAAGGTVAGLAAAVVAGNRFAQPANKVLENQEERKPLMEEVPAMMLGAETTKTPYADRPGNAPKKGAGDWEAVAEALRAQANDPSQGRGG